MNLLCHTARIYRHNVGHLLVPSLTSTRCLSSSQWKKYLNVLEVDKDSTTKDIKDSFLKLSKVYHPDNKLTGSHCKFVELKEAYDALRDGHPTITPEYKTSNRYNNYYDTDVSYQAHKAYRDKYRDYTYGQSNYGFGGPYKHSSTPWEDLKRDREYRRQKYQYESYPRSQGKGLINVTIVLSAMAWVVIYSCVLLFWDYRDSAKNELLTKRIQQRDDYLQYQDYLRRKEEARKYRERVLKDPKYTVVDAKSKEKYITSNGQLIMKSSQVLSSSSPSSPLSTASLESEAIASKPSTSGAVPDVGAL